MNTCPICGRPMPPLNRDGEPRRYCGRECSIRGEGKPKVRDMYLEEVQHFDSLGMAPSAILSALNVTAANLARALTREGRPDLARPYHLIVNRSRAKACLDCGKVRSSRYDRCWTCARQHRANLERTATRSAA